MLYGLQCSPCHWYDKINAILQSIGLMPLLDDPPCLYTGFIWDPSDPLLSLTTAPLSFGLYIADFVYFYEDLAVKALFYYLFAECCKVDFLGIVDFSASFFCGASPLPQWRSISTNMALPPIWLKFFQDMPVTRPLRQRHIAWEHPSIQSLPLSMPMTPPHSFVLTRHIRASLAASVGCHLLLTPISSRLTPSSPPTLISRHQDT
jgi:hypothetical protein